MLAVDAVLVGLSPTYRAHPKPPWRSAAAQCTLSSGPRREKVRIHVSMFNRVYGPCICCLHVYNYNWYSFFPLFLPLQTVLLRLSPTLLICRTAWCLLWRLRTPSYCTTRSRRFPLAWWPTSTITHSVTLPGKAARSCIIFEVSYLFLSFAGISQGHKNVFLHGSFNSEKNLLAFHWN